MSGSRVLSSAVCLRVTYERYCIRKWGIPTDIVQLYVNLSAAPPLGVSGLSVNGGFMRAVCLYVSVSSAETSQRSWGCPCLCQTSVSEQSVLTGSQRCLIARCLFPVRRRKLDGIFGFCHTCLTNQQSRCKQDIENIYLYICTHTQAQVYYAILCRIFPNYESGRWFFLRCVTGLE